MNDPRNSQGNTYHGTHKSLRIPKGVLRERVSFKNASIDDSQSSDVTKRNEKNQRDVKKSLANLGRDEIFKGRPTDIDPQTLYGFKLKPQSSANILVKGELKEFPHGKIRVNPLQIPPQKELKKEDLYLSKKGTYQQGRDRNSITGFKREEQKHDIFPEITLRPLYTEGDVPMRDTSLVVSFSAAFAKNTSRDKGGVDSSEKNQNQSQGSGVKPAMSNHFGPKLSGSKSSAVGTKTRTTCDTQENQQELLTLNGISDGVKYTEGGVGLYAGEKRERIQEGEPLDWSSDKKKEKPPRQNSSERRRLKNIPKEKINKWKNELSDIRRDIEKRRKSYEKVDEFFKANDENGSFAKEIEAVKRSQQRLQTCPDMSTKSALQLVLPISSSQIGVEQVHSPSFPALSNSPGSDLSQYDKLQSNRSRSDEKVGKIGTSYPTYLTTAVGEESHTIENRKDESLCKMSYCRPAAGCQIF